MLEKQLKTMVNFEIEMSRAYGTLVWRSSLSVT
jgi:hypothetical protein